MRRFTQTEVVIALLAVVLLAAASLALDPASVTGEGQDKDVICHRGVEITVADPAIFQAHLDHGDCVGTCYDCEGRCCYRLDGVSVTGLMLQYECDKVNGRFQYDKAMPCFAGGD